MQRVPASLLLAGLIVFLVITFGKLSGHTSLIREIQDTLHTVVFTVFTYFALQLMHRRAGDSNTTSANYLLVAGLCLLTGVAAEAAQWLTGRGFGLLDIVRDMAGIVLGAGFHALHARTTQGSRLIPRRHLRRTLAVALSVILCAAIYPLASLSWHYQGRNAAFPVIMDVQADWATAFLEPNAARLTPAPKTCGPAFLALQLLPADYPGIDIVDPSPDWRGYRYLGIELHSANPAPVNLTLRVHDRAHNNEFSDRFNYTLTVTPGTHQYRIALEDISNAPTGRKLDLASIAGVKLFSGKHPHPQKLCVGVIRLEQ
ncbi:MAG: hypothetical protein KJO10_04725 [Gammaproteobacteria bacterium]|nr:hypothetical protein [Gammaproteobacteria bacterium]